VEVEELDILVLPELFALEEQEVEVELMVLKLC
jgi:hypothetical protein